MRAEHWCKFTKPHQQQRRLHRSGQFSRSTKNTRKLTYMQIYFIFSLAVSLSPLSLSLSLSRAFVTHKHIILLYNIYDFFSYMSLFLYTFAHFQYFVLNFYLRKYPSISLSVSFHIYNPMVCFIN